MNLSVLLKTSLKTNAGDIIPAGKIYNGEVSEFPSWLVNEIKSNSSALDVKEILTESILPVSKPYKKESSESKAKLVRRANKQ